MDTPSFGYSVEDFSHLDLIEEVGADGSTMELSELDKRRSDHERDTIFVSELFIYTAKFILSYLTFMLTDEK